MLLNHHHRCAWNSFHSNTGWDGVEFESAVSTIDITPTILDFANIEIPDTVDGVSWKNAVEDTDYADASDDYRCLFFESEHDR